MVKKDKQVEEKPEEVSQSCFCFPRESWLTTDADTETLPEMLLLPSLYSPSFRHFLYNPAPSNPLASTLPATAASHRVSFFCQAKRSNMVPRERNTLALPPRTTEEVWKHFNSAACSCTCASDYTSALAVDLCLCPSVQEMKKTSSYNKAKLRGAEEKQVLCWAPTGSGL